MELVILGFTCTTGLLYILQLSCCSSWIGKLLPAGVLAVSLYLLHYLVINTDSSTILHWLDQDNIRRNFSILIMLDIIFQLQLNQWWLQQPSYSFRKALPIPSPVLLCGLFYTEVCLYRELSIDFEAIAIGYACLVAAVLVLGAVSCARLADRYLRLEWRYGLLILSGILAVLFGTAMPEIVH
ncbi:hypothetical protein CLV59_105297 [Chitinophaga dinghuensis]|uniref:Uncharacterized protein n=1 Tax=Chitinophaga dinghuensis TaxID=1539050 RepID=A0A327VW71_9BACT|nr:hypothetical protein [Chitinophaga dinghuensis]RAJ80189.1 hypothetical protein CLV59_105297 [Chitinophaga dinghuensis]